MKKRLISIIPIALTVIISCALMFAVYYTQDRTFMFIESSGLFRDKIAIKQTDAPQTKAIPISELDNAENVTLDQSLMLINTEYTLQEDFVPAITEFRDTKVFLNECALAAFTSLSEYVKENFGQKLYVSSDLRSAEEQEDLYEEDPNTATSPGASEHQSGLALDVYAAYYAGDIFIRSPIGRYVNSHCHEYGFIIRYPSYGEEITGIRFEPWHIRFVGEPHAKVIYGNMLTLEEYILSFEIGQWYSVDGYLISRQIPQKGALSIPESFKSCTVSPDNTGAYIITVSP